ncbi:hypothetical protein QUF72_14230 [Desulfobacterales bacterium HSG2]|nr:hypothetical protein [Desulfobacterales bacterium HSG2]
MSVVSCQLSVVGGQLSVVGGQLSVIGGPLFSERKRPYATDNGQRTTDN